MSSFLFILLIVAFIGLTIFRWWYNSPQQKGKRGEMRIHDILMRFFSSNADCQWVDCSQNVTHSHGGYIYDKSEDVPILTHPLFV